MAERGRQAHPMGAPFGPRLTHSAPSRAEQLVQIERGSALSQVIPGPGSCMGPAGQRVTLARLFLYTSEGLFAPWIVPAGQPRGVGAGPLEVGMTHLGA
jgi:hypothetical protein